MSDSRKIDWLALRKDFPILDQQVHGKPLIYFDNAATSQKPRAVIQALVHYYEHDNANVHRGIHELSNRATHAFENARARVARFLNARSAEEIVWTRGTSEAINLVASTWGSKHLKPGDVILLTEAEHHSNIVPWQLLAQKTGAKVAYIPVTGDEGTLDLSKLDSMLTSSVKLLSLVHISNSMGVVNPVAELCARARQLGIVTLVDGAQSAGHMPVDVQAIGCDFFAFSGHKICGPTGIGALYGRAEVLEKMPPYQGGGEMILTVGYDKTTFKPGAASLRGRHARHLRPDRPARRDGLPRRHRSRQYLEARPGAGQLRPRSTRRVAEHPALRPEDRARRSRELFAQGRSCARRRHAGGSRRRGIARGSSLHPAAHAQTRRRIHRPRQFLFLQHQSRSGSLRRSREGNPEVLRELRLVSPAAIGYRNAWELYCAAADGWL